ncbi:MAG TPA: zf-HC2 domain-containing protein [Longimicrobiales bacterium]
MHINEGRLQALLDGELDAVERAAVATHVEGCTTCGAELDGLRAAAVRLSNALRRLDVPAPVDRAWARLGQRRAAERAAAVRRALLRAAAMIVGCAAVAAAALPGSPVRAWIGEVWGGAAEKLAEPTVAPAPAVPVQAPAPGPAGVSILPSQGRVRILIEGAVPETRLRVRLTSGERVAVYVYGASGARFRTGADRIAVAGAGPGEVRIEVPSSLANATVEVDGRLLVAKDGAQLRSTVDSIRPGTEVLLPLGPDPSSR